MLTEFKSMNSSGKERESKRKWSVGNLVFICKSVYICLEFVHLVRKLQTAHNVKIWVVGVFGSKSDSAPIDEQMCIHLQIIGDPRPIAECHAEALKCEVRGIHAFSSTCPKSRHRDTTDIKLSKKLNQGIRYK